MAEPPPLTSHDASDRVAASASASEGATALAIQILTGDGSLTQAVEQVGRHLSSYPGVDLIAAAMTQIAPAGGAGWVHLGRRAWLREWSRPGTTCSVAPRQNAGAEQALTMPWVSQQVLRGAVAVVPDAQLLPPEADRDRREMASCGVAALVTGGIVADGAIFGSIAMCREVAGPWPPSYLADVHLLSATLGSRMSAARAQESLADAIRRGDLARASQQEFFAAIGHELRTPIAAIVGTAEMLGSDASELGAGDVGAFANGVEADAKVLLSAGEQLLAIVDDLLNTGQELGGGVESQWVDVADAVSDVVHWLRTPALSAGVTVVASVGPGVLTLSTPSGMRQILTNLVGNAIAYNRRGGSVTVTTSRTRNEFGEPRVRVSVQDTGPGLTPQQQRDVFKPFVRFAGPEIRGTGLGLSLSRSLAERDGGMLGVESTPGDGSVFWLDLPGSPA